MSNIEQNKQIAKILGFEEIPPTPERGINFTQWKYPTKWKDYIYASPVDDIPDFISLMDKALEIDKMFNYGIPKQG